MEILANKTQRPSGAGIAQTLLGGEAADSRYWLTEEGALDRKIQPKQIAEVQKNIHLPIVANSLLAMRHAVDPLLLWSWLTLVIGWNIARLMYFKSVKVEAAHFDSQRRWARHYTIAALIAGALWGSAGFMMFPAEQIHYQVFLAFVLGGISAGAVASYAGWLPSYYAFVVPAILPVSFCFAVQGTELGYFMGGMLVLFTGMLTLLAKSFNQTLVTTISMQFEKTQLATERDISEAFFTRAFHSSPAVMAISNTLNGTHYDVNEAWCSLTGYDYEDAMANSSLELGIWARPEDRAQMIAQLEETGSARDIETVFLTKDGEEIEMLVAGEYIEAGGELRFLFIGLDISRLKEVERLKTDFLSVISHELRTPLTSIKGAIGVIQSGALGEHSFETMRLLHLADKNADRLGGLVNDILDFEQLHSGRMEFRFDTHDLNDIVVEAIGDKSQIAREKGVVLNFQPTDAPALAQLDNKRMIQAVSQLLSNAIKFSPKNQSVDISILRHDDKFRLEISDHGPGIPEHQRETIFSLFSQGDGTATRSEDGTGIGLSIAKAIVDGHFGDIDFVSADGKGTIFFIDLPFD